MTMADKSDIRQQMHRIVHLDMKGAPPKLPYLEQVLQCIRAWGATGILIEWEDTFPYTCELVDIGSNGTKGDELYSMDQVKRIMQVAEQNGLLVIQLVQTIGHMEFVLKHSQCIGLREIPRAPNVLCPSKPDSQLLVRSMLEQVLDAQPNATHIHIGADEVWHYGVCEDCSLRATQNKNGVASLYLQHIRDIALFLHKKRPNLQVLIWDDMLRGYKCDILQEYNLGELVQPVVWNYSPIEVFHVDENLWFSYKKIFPHVWVGSAFKGANGCTQISVSSARYASNQEAWIREVDRNPCEINFDGVILTGWSRFDHYATFCELLPLAMPSLACCLGKWTKTGQEKIKDSLAQCDWPGYEMARAVHSFVVLRDRCLALIRGDEVAGWMNPWQVENKYINPMQIQGLAITAERLVSELATAENDLRSTFQFVIGERSEKEWIGTLLSPLVKQLRHICDVYQSNTDVRPRPALV